MVEYSRKKMRPRDRGTFVDSMVDNRNEALANEWLDKFALDPGNQAKLVEFVRIYRPGFSLPKMIYNGIRGSYNVNWRLEFQDGLSVMIHVPIPHAVAFSDEKILAEVAAMKLIRDHTTIPAPEVYGWGTAAENPTGYGPFIVMEYIKHTKSLEHVLLYQMENVEGSGITKRHYDKTLLRAYRQMSHIMLQLSRIEATPIGYPSLPETPEGELLPFSSSASSSTNSAKSQIYRVHHRPITHSTNDLVTMGGIPPSILPPNNKTYNTAEYYQFMADMHLAHLAFQHNNSVLSRPDGREKYVARQLFRKLASEGRLAVEDDICDDKTLSRERKEVFKLWCDDMRPASVLLNDNDDVVGVIDWEMSYFAPASFHHNPPWWLIIDKPEFYEKGLSSWAKEYERHLPLFLQAMELEEAELRGTIEETRDGDGTLHRRRQPINTDEAGEGERYLGRLSMRMKQNWENRSFFVDYCARRSYGFDPIYWKYLDTKFFGKDKKTALLLRRGGYKGRQHFLTERERAQMETFISWKLEDRDDEKIVEWDEKDAQAILAACLAGELGDIDIPKPRLIPWTVTDHSEDDGPHQAS